MRLLSAIVLLWFLAWPAFGVVWIEPTPGGGGVTQLDYISAFEVTGGTTDCTNEVVTGAVGTGTIEDLTPDSDCDDPTAAKGSQGADGSGTGLRFDWTNESSAVDYQMRFAVYFATTPGDVGFWVSPLSSTTPDLLWVEINTGNSFNIRCTGTGGGDFGPASLTTAQWYWITLSYDESLGSIEACAETTEHDGSGTCGAGPTTCAVGTGLIWDYLQITGTQSGSVFDEMQGGAFTAP